MIEGVQEEDAYCLYQFYTKGAITLLASARPDAHSDRVEASLGDDYGQLLLKEYSGQDGDRDATIPWLILLTREAQRRTRAARLVKPRLVQLLLGILGLSSPQTLAAVRKRVSIVLRPLENHFDFMVQLVLPEWEHNVSSHCREMSRSSWSPNLLDPVT